MKASPQDFCADLGRRFDDLAPILRDHVADNDGILPHVFMGDVTRYVLSGGSQRREVVGCLNDALKNGSAEIQGLIAVSFVENIGSDVELDHALREVQADTLRDEWRRQNS